MLSRLVTCSKKMPSDALAGDDAARSERPPAKIEIVDDSPSPTPSIVTTAHESKPEAPAAAAACAAWWSTRLRSAPDSPCGARRRRSAARLAASSSGHDRHSVTVYFARRVSEESGPGGLWRRRTA